jgi:hypothetical protein
VSRPALGTTQPPVQWVPGVLSPGLKRGRDVTLTAHPHLVPRSRMRRSYISSPPCVSTGVLWDCLLLLHINRPIYYTHFLTVYSCFAFKKYTGTSKFPFRALLCARKCTWPKSVKFTIQFTPTNVCFQIEAAECWSH